MTAFLIFLFPVILERSGHAGGMDYADGDALVIMDADLQDPPELLPDMITWWEKGYRDVSARRHSREGETFFKKWSSHVYYKLLKKLTSVPVQQDVGDFRLLDRRCVQALCSMRECQRYTKGLFSWIGFEKKEILFDRPPRAAGKTAAGSRNAPHPSAPAAGALPSFRTRKHGKHCLAFSPAKGGGRSHAPAKFLLLKHRRIASAERFQLSFPRCRQTPHC